MQLLHTLYPYALAAANISGGWLLFDVLGTHAGALLVTVGAVVLLAAASELFGAALEGNPTGK